MTEKRAKEDTQLSALTDAGDVTTAVTVVMLLQQC